MKPAPRPLSRLTLTEAEAAGAAQVAAVFPVGAPGAYLDRIDPADPSDPIRRQVVPELAELTVDPREVEDPIGDLAHSPAPRLTHRYPNRVLLVPTYQCAVYCRHCFRKESLLSSDPYSADTLTPALDYIRAHPELREVILTGGDPLVLSNAALEALCQQLEQIDHLRLLRGHSRLPVVQPGRVNAGLVRALRGGGRLQVAVVTHFNHAREIGPETAEAARRLREAGFLLLNQTVLLRGVNDSVGALSELFEALVYTLGVKPYYLHHCDLTRGLAHLRTPIDQGLALMAALRGRLSGLCLPTYVLDLPGGQGKIPLGQMPFTVSREGGDWLFQSPEGALCPYSEVVLL
jgi:lysine 2,3-aminomutase